MPRNASHPPTVVSKPFRPSLVDEVDLQLIQSALNEIHFDHPQERARNLRRFAAEYASRSEEPARHLRAAVAASMLADLQEQGWDVRSQGPAFAIIPPEVRSGRQETHDQAKDRQRQSLLTASNRQLATDGVQEFLRTMERPRAFEGRIVSVASLIDNGQDLAARLDALNGLSDAEKLKGLERVIQPSLELCDSDSKCAITGLRLQDIWRYFRHTWSLEYNSLPGRTMRFLIRNKAHPNWPVIGIAMLASPPANMIVRDSWIGWRLDDLVQGILNHRWEAKAVGTALLAAIEEAIAFIRSDDLLTSEELARADRSAIFKLSQIAARTSRDRLSELQNRAQGKEHHSPVDIRDLGRPTDLQSDDWRKLSETSLYVKKRAEQLIPLLEAISYFRSAGLHVNPAAAVMESLVTNQGRHAVATALNEIKKKALATEVADVSVCGAVAPYNELLGGKLVALLMASREARQHYSNRYGGQISEIASQVGGRPVSRSAELKLVTTTSLYGIGSSQYNRLKIDADNYGLKNSISWIELEKTKGFTVTHVSRVTVEYMRSLGEVVHGARRINSVFGEGSSPRTRQIREGLNLIGINNEHVLRHSMVRRVYACELFDGARDALTGFARSKPSKGETTKAISRAWLKRWVIGRISKPEIVDRVRGSNPAQLAQELHQRSILGMPGENTPVDGLQTVGETVAEAC